jgi:antitoxin HigA-1
MLMKNPVHPGEILSEVICELGLSVTGAAEVLGVTRVTVSKVINGRSSISPEMAIRLSQAFGSTPDFWLRLQLNYDLEQAREKAAATKIKRYIPPLGAKPCTTT